MKKWLLTAILLSSACVPTPAPVITPPAPVAGVGITVQPPVATHIKLGSTECDSNEEGIAFCFPVGPGDYFVKLDLPSEYEADAGGIYSINQGSCPTWPNCEIVIQVTRKGPVFPVVERAGIVGSGPRFTVNGQPWQWRGSTDFMLFRDYLDGKDISAVLTQRVTAGANIVRVLGMAHYIPVNAGQPAFAVATYPDYFQRLTAFVNYVATYGLRVEFTALADAQILMPETTAQVIYLQHVVDALPVTAVIELCNEPFKNGCDVKTLMAKIHPVSLMATGDYTWENPVVGLYVTVHESRDDEWPRKSRLDEWYAKVRVPAVWDEPMGADENNQPGRRSNNVADFFDLCAGAALHGAGITFHSTDGLLSVLWGPIQHSAAVACYNAAKAIPPDAPTWSYSRGGLADSPLVHDDAIALRTFCQITVGQAVCEVVRPNAAWTAVAQNGWRIASQTGPNGRLVFLTR